MRKPISVNRPSVSGLAAAATAFADPASFFHRFAALDDVEADDLARSLWRGINEPNLVANIL